MHGFHAFLKATSVSIVSTPEERVLERYADAIHPKDVPILAAAVEAKVDYLVTLDRRHFLNKAVFSKAVDVKVLTPGDFLTMMVQHPT